MKSKIFETMTYFGVPSLYLCGKIKYVRTVDAAELRREVDSYSQQLRELDVEIQRLNWAVDLEE
jgi:hypothetical protein